MSRIRSFYRGIKIIRLKAPEDVHGAATFPSATFVDVSQFKYVDVVCNMGAVTASVTFSLFENHASTGGTLDAIDATYAKLTVGTANADKVALFHLDTEHLSDNHNWIAIKTAGGGGGTYGDILFFLHGAKTMSVSNPTATFPTAIVKELSG